MNIALIGNPNCGKTTLFNRLTGNRLHVGNWPGVTVEKKVGEVKNRGVFLVDLPGIYSLSPYSMEERIARDFLLQEKPQGIINLLDATSPERSLYLTLQVIELGIPTVVAVNMADVLKQRGDTLNDKGIASFLGVPVIPISAKKNENLDLLMETVLLQKPKSSTVRYDTVTRKYIDRIKKQIGNIPFADFLAPKVLESDPWCLQKFSPRDIQEFEKTAKAYEAESSLHDRELSLAQSRYRIAEQITKTFLQPNPHPSERITDKIDAIVLHPFFALPIFALLMLLTFYATFSGFGTALQHGMEYLLQHFIAIPFSEYMTAIGISDWLHSLLMDGIFTGISSVLQFLPQILVLFLCLSLLEDSGYMARAAFIMDSLLRKTGLSGKAFIPLLMGFGCTTTAVMATRTMEREADRKLTILLTPFMSCGAKLPIYTLFIGTFFQAHQSLFLFGLYFLGLLSAMLCGWLLKHAVADNAPFLMELPPYRLPGFRNTVGLLLEKAKSFLTKAGTVIFVMSICIWCMQNFNFHFVYTRNPEDSMLGSIGSFLAPLFTPLGFGHREAVIALLCGLIAKESVVSSLTVLYGGNPLQGIIAHFTPASACSFMVFCLLYVPCISAFITMSRELRSKRWTEFSFCFQMTVAWLVAFLVYQLCCFVL